MKKKVLFICSIIFVLIFVSYIWPRLDFFKNARIKHDKAYSAFLNNDVLGVIEKVDYCDHAVSIELDNSKFYLCDPYTTKALIFIKEATKGDSIIKFKNQNHFRLKKTNGEEMVFNILDRTETNNFYKKY